MIGWLGRHDLALVLAFAIAACGIWVFAEIADAVLERETHGLDRAVLLSMRQPADLGDPIGPMWFEELARDVTALGGMAVLVPTTLAVIGYLLLRRAYAIALLVTVAAAGAQIASSLLKLGVDRPRPDLVPGFVQVYSASFPSGHALVSAAVYLTFALQLAQIHRGLVIRGYLIGIALMLVTAIGASRVYLGVHWPTDVVAGWAAGSAWALLVWSGARFYKTRRDGHPGAG